MKGAIKIPESVMNELRHEVYLTLIAGYDNEGNELGMGEMGICEETAQEIIEAWVRKSNIKII